MIFEFTSNKIRFESNHSTLESFYHFFDQDLFSNSLLFALRNSKDEEAAKEALKACKEICKKYFCGTIITRQEFVKLVNEQINKL